MKPQRPTLPKDWMNECLQIHYHPGSLISPACYSHFSKSYSNNLLWKDQHSLPYSAMIFPSDPDLSSLVLLFPCWCKYFRCFSQLSGLLRLNLSVFFSHLFSCPCSEQVLPGFSFFFVISIVALLRLVSPIPTTAFFEFVFASLTLRSDVFAQNIWSLWPTCAPLEGSKNFSSLFVACFWTQEIPHSLLLDLIHQRFKKKNNSRWFERNDGNFCFVCLRNFAVPFSYF